MPHALLTDPFAILDEIPPDAGVEVYSLTAFLLFINDVIPEDQALDQQSLPKVKMPIGDKYAPLPDWKPRTKRLQGYPF